MDYKMDLAKPLGTGGFGRVFRVNDSIGNDAMKKIKFHYDSIDCLLANVIEAKALKTLQHPNVIRMINYGLWISPDNAEPDSDSPSSSSGSFLSDYDIDEGFGSVINERDYSFIVFDQNKKSDDEGNLLVANQNDNNTNNTDCKEEISMRKRAILFIRMPIRPFTLHDWLEKRNKESDFSCFHEQFLKKSRKMPKPSKEDRSESVNSAECDMNISGLYELYLDFNSIISFLFPLF